MFITIKLIFISVSKPREIVLSSPYIYQYCIYPAIYNVLEINLTHYGDEDELNRDKHPAIATCAIQI
jgi:hypothetical protein